MFKFNYIFCKHSEPLKVIEEADGSGYNNRGIWQQKGKEEKDITGIVLSLTNNDLKYTEEGRYELRDKKILTKVELELHSLIKRENGEYFKINECKDNKKHSNYYMYLARRVENYDFERLNNNGDK